MAADKDNPSTREILAEAEKLSGGRQSAPPPSTRQLIRDSEKLIGREPSGGSTARTWLILLAVLAGAAVIAWLIFSIR